MGVTQVLLVFYMAAGISLTRCEGSYELNFPEKSVFPQSNYALTRSLKDFTSFTLCFWLKTRSPNRAFPISYSNNVYNKSLAIEVSSAGASLHLFGNPFAIMTCKGNFNDDRWHHVCFTWNSTDTTVVTYAEGVETYRFSFFGWHAGFITKGGGCLVFGQKQGLQCSGFGHSFSGSISEVNMWDYPLSPGAVEKVCKGCWSYGGNIFNWCQSRVGRTINGDVRVTRGSLTCDSSVAEGAFLPQRNVILLGHVIATHNAVHMEHCASQCLRHCECSSFNLQMLAETLYKCEIIGFSKTSKKLQHTEGWMHYNKIDT